MLSLFGKTGTDSPKKLSQSNLPQIDSSLNNPLYYKTSQTLFKFSKQKKKKKHKKKHKKSKKKEKHKKKKKKKRGHESQKRELRGYEQG